MSRAQPIPTDQIWRFSRSGLAQVQSIDRQIELQVGDRWIQHQAHQNRYRGRVMVRFASADGAKAAIAPAIGLVLEDAFLVRGSVLSQLPDPNPDFAGGILVQLEVPVVAWGQAIAPDHHLLVTWYVSEDPAYRSNPLYQIFLQANHEATAQSQDLLRPRPRPPACEGCTHYHGYAYEGSTGIHWLCCGLHPSGPAGGVCGDWCGEKGKEGVKA
ncbi:hypothetical protein HNI00_06850 [Thermoleptolyngbya oregonensis NK1-22]|uniref:Uncharacterized protein n=1 Tax=Thermoleptolyngbya oregonensis NK1-22 TaxID=2547457 RepID=A0AA97BCP0_9CYAN|nr:hypothetical protein [Thermoleptolyngbya oregonensis]WOB42896.1 hypothetical protein HNI00_06850 [Thermoleptolyngbya oregonensis NK1-22]